MSAQASEHGTVAADGEIGIKRQPRPRRGLCLVQAAELCQGASAQKADNRQIGIGLYRPLIPADRFLVATEKKLGASCVARPMIGVTVARTDAKRLLNMSFSFLGMSEINLCGTNEKMSERQIPIQGQRVFKLGYGLVGAVVKHAERA